MMVTFYYWLAAAFSLTLVLKAAAQTSSPSCAGLDDLTATANRDELNCITQENCIGVQCTSLNSQFRILVEFTRVTLLPCASDTPAVLFELLGAVDPLTEQRRVVFSGELRGDTVIPLALNTIPFGNVNVTFGLLEHGLIEFALQRSDEGAMKTIQLINSTSIRLNFNPCPQQTETTTGRSTDSTTTTNGTQTTLPLLSMLVASILSFSALTVL